MAQDQQDQEFDPGALLIQTLSESVAGLTEEASNKLIQSSVAMIENETVAQTSSILDIGKETTDDLYTKLTDLAVVGKTILPPRTRVIPAIQKFGSVQKTIDPTTGHITITNAPEPIRTNINPAQTARNVMDQAGQSFPAIFDIEKEMVKLKGLKGEELASAITAALSTLDVELTKRRQIIGKQAAIESGYVAAQTALERSLQGEHIPNPNFGGLSFNQRFGFASAQTQTAENFASKTRIQMLALEESMIKRDTITSQINSARNAILKMEMRTAQRQMAQEEKLEAITSSMVANYKFIYGKDLDDLTARKAIAARATKDPIVAKTVMVTPENAYTVLLDPELRVRENAFKLVLEYDKAANHLDPSATQTPITERIKEFIKEPIKILDASIAIGAIPKKEADKLRIQWMSADTKERASLQQGALAFLLEKYIERQYELGYNDMKKWRANEMDMKQPLGIIVDRISKATPSGKAPIDTVIETFIMDHTIVGPDNKQMTYDQKLQILNSALSGTITNDFKSILYPNTDSLQIKVSNNIKNMAARAFIKVKTIGPESGIWEYRKDLGRP